MLFIWHTGNSLPCGIAAQPLETNWVVSKEAGRHPGLVGYGINPMLEFLGGD